MRILSYKYEDHDANFCLYDNGLVKYYMPERRHGIKHYGYFPLEIPKNDDFLPLEVFDHFGISPEELDVIVEVPDDPINGENKFKSLDILWCKTNQNYFGYDIPSFWVEHHWAHVNSIWPISEPTEYSVVYDGLGSSNIHASIFRGEERIEVLKRNNCESVCLEFIDLGWFCGIDAKDPLDIPGKVMGYQSFGDKYFATEVFENLYSNYSLETSPKMDDIVYSFQDDYDIRDIAMGYQMWVEHAFMDWVEKYVPTDASVSFTGGLAQNVLLNTTFSKKYKNLIIPPHVNDCGLSVGALGVISKVLDLNLNVENFPFIQSDESPTETPTKETITTIAKELANGKIVAMYQGNGEIGPRALGNRSILMDPTVQNGKDIINRRVKKRESYRPFGAAVMLEHVEDWFEWEGETPYMLHAVKVKNSSIESVIHVDNTCRIQTVSCGIMYELLDEFNKLKNVPILLNTSLNLAGKPIAGTIEDAKQLFEEVDIDVLCYGNTILYK